jgi:ATP-dependent DNA helicase RecG
MGTSHVRKNIVESYRELAASHASTIPQACPNLGHETLKELLINAYIHRCYRVGGAIVITARSDVFEIQNPGELSPGIRSDNLIYCVPFYRNLLLADGARFIGLCDKIGQGVDLIYRAVLSGGFDFPVFYSDGGNFTAHIPLVGSDNFREFVRRRSQAINSLDEIVVLRILFSQQDASVDELCSGMQRGKEIGIKILRQMQTKLMLDPSSEGRFSLSSVIRGDIESIFQSDQLSFERALFGEY